MRTVLKRLTILSFLLAAIWNLSADAALGGYEHERTDGGYYTLVGEEEEILTRTALPVYKDDEFITPDNRRFKVTGIEGDTCRCTLVGVEKMPEVKAEVSKSSGLLGLTPVIAKNRGNIGIYCTHSDESYIPSDGKESMSGRGGIYQVGEALRDALKSQGVNAVLDKTSHGPHDVNAYSRSRRTASKLLKQGCVGLLDVHRDAVPAEVYAAKVNNQKVTRVKLVVGKQNPHMSSNLEFAKKIKAYLDEKCPGLSAGIFMGRGNYNQDLSPRSILVEVGTHTNSKEDAQRGIEMFAQVLPDVFGVESEQESDATPLVNVSAAGNQRSDWTAAILILLGAAVAYGAYIAINRKKTK
jgi:stage II sporulation protein P